MAEESVHETSPKEKRVNNAIQINDQIGRWLVLSEPFSKRTRQGRTRIFRSCRCDCGVEKPVEEQSLRLGLSVSCGCQKAEKASLRLRLHGEGRKDEQSAEFRIWLSMKNRCNYPSSRAYKFYGGRGIKIDPRWERDFLSFLADMGRRPTNRHSIDRIDGNDGYKPGNCRWATKSEQMRNTRRNRLVEFDGRTMPLAEAAELAGLPRYVVSQRITKLGWSDSRALTEPVNRKFGAPHKPA